MITSDFGFYAFRKLLSGTSPPWSSLRLIALTTSIGSIPRETGVLYTDPRIELAFPEILALDTSDWTIQEYVDPDPPPPDPDEGTITPEVFPHITLDVVDKTWTNNTLENVTVQSLAIIGDNDELLVLHPVNPAAIIAPDAEYTPTEFIIRIRDSQDEDINNAIILYETTSNYEAGSHLDEAIIDTTRPTWGDLGEEGLGAEFKTALEKLERLLYAVCGAVPFQTSPSFKNWWHRKNPRCMWWPEIWRAQWCGELLDCDFYYEFEETAARGGIQYSGMPAPRVPIRSRSGDWKGQNLLAEHNLTYFPKLSVSRQDGSQVDLNGDQLYDPLGTGDFGGNPAAIGSDGPDHIVGETIEVTYTKPDNEDIICNSIDLEYNLITIGMTETSPGVWKATIPAQDHDTLVEYKVTGEFVDVNDPESTVIVSDPVSGFYSFTAFSHYIRYPRGLPELWDKSLKSTDQYAFDNTETIQYELINLVRFVLDYLGSLFVHSPKLRTGIPQCCFDHRITWLWSGSAPYPHYMAGGKDETQPLHDLEAEGDYNSDARRSWRGFPSPIGDYSEEFPADEMEASWLSPPAKQNLMLLNPSSSECELFWDGAKRGLQPNDIINKVHILELISAIDYLINNGLWAAYPIKKRPYTPLTSFINGLGCGCDNEVGCSQHACFESCDGPDIEDCVAFTAPEWEDCFINLASGPCWTQVIYGRTCNYNSLDAEWAESVLQESTSCFSIFSSVPASGFTCLEADAFGKVPSGGGFFNWLCEASEDESSLVINHICSFSVCGWDGYICGPQEAPYGPDANHGNFNGNIGFKPRMNQNCPSPAPSLGGQPPFSLGNKLGDTYACSINVDTDDHTAPFESISHHRFSGWNDLYIECFPGFCSDTDHCDCWDENELPQISNYLSYWNFFTETPEYQLNQNECDDTTSSGTRDTYGIARATMTLGNLCTSDVVWCAIDLNLDGAGQPYANFSEGYAGAKMPVLYDYLETMSPDSIHFPEEGGPYAWEDNLDCPCDTEDSELVCSDFI